MNNCILWSKKKWISAPSKRANREFQTVSTVCKPGSNKIKMCRSATGRKSCQRITSLYRLPVDVLHRESMEDSRCSARTGSGWRQNQIPDINRPRVHHSVCSFVGFGWDLPEKKVCDPALLICSLTARAIFTRALTHVSIVGVVCTTLVWFISTRFIIQNSK